MPGKNVSKRMKKTVIAIMLVAICVLINTPQTRASAGNNNLKIYEVAGAGGLTGASYRQDTIILFNPTQGTITCSTCAIQFHSSTSNSSAWSMYMLPALAIPAGGYYMIAASDIELSKIGSVAPIAYDYELGTLEGTASKSLNIMSSSAHEVALTSEQTTLTANSKSGTVCSNDTSIILDVVAYSSSYKSAASGSIATKSYCYAGSSAAPYDNSTKPGRKFAAIRKNKCIDTYNNGADFTLVPIEYYNSSSAPTACGTGTKLSEVLTTDKTTVIAAEDVTFFSKITPATIPASSSISAYVDFTSPYFSATPEYLYDDGSNGDVKAGDGIYSLTTKVPPSAVSGYSYLVNVVASDAQGNQYRASKVLAVSKGSISLAASSTNGTVASGGVVYFPVTITSIDGYNGSLLLTCTGSPNANIANVPEGTQCLANPAQIAMTSDGTTTTSVAVAAGTAVSAGVASGSWKWGVCLVLCLVLCGAGICKRNKIFLSVLLVGVCALTLGSTACETQAGLGNTSAKAGTYTYTVTAQDVDTETNIGTINFTVVIQ